ncbi:DUF456 domain-containing protein [Natronorubrum sp. JWXQ-INN-674]|uniref:DUF456 domain-containing protein n=1 Tax=Natronorubrum halalkaliphilum TaxID=2691917 RepID=A0A6B0VR23_9EURY|nr:DUF456 domain-containing protein [Natronorubrum halalkaliphilum]MXV63633.1 DUF456 domain-containing protein [Natronorubrum halalkaliphilum]
MSDRSDEVTESRDTDDLLEETEQLLSESGVGADVGESQPSAETGRSRETGRAADPATADVDDTDGASADAAGDSWWPLSDETARPGEDSVSDPDAADTSGTSRLSGLKSRLSAGSYFSPKAFLALVLAVGAGLLGGATVLPFGGRMVGMFGVAFLIGLLTSRRRYLEMAAAGTSVGALSAVVSNAFFALAGSFRTVAAVGVTVGLVACLIGYYFGRDLRDGLARDIE